MTARGLRNNNPGNIRYVEGITSTYQGCTGSDGAFCQFDTAENGIRALAVLLLSYQDRHDIHTIKAAINRWAPPVENDTGAYVVVVAGSTGLDPDAVLDFRDPVVLVGLARAIIKHENGTQPYTEFQLANGVGAALGVAITAETQPPAPVVERTVPKETTMPFAALIPALIELIPQVAKLFSSGSEVATRNTAALQIVADTAVKTANAVNLQDAIEKMQADKAVQLAVQQAVVTEPTIMGLLEVGGGIKVARDASIVMQNADRPFWYNPMFWITILFFPMMYMITLSILFTTNGGAATDPWWSRVGFDSETRAGLVNLIVGFVFGGVVGVWFGTSYGSQRKTEIAANTAQ